jgi:hypothetical protein
MPLSTIFQLWRSVLLVEETGVPGEKHKPVASHWQTLSHTADLFGVFILCQHFEISYSRNANQHIIIGVYITIKSTIDQPT